LGLRTICRRDSRGDGGRVVYQIDVDGMTDQEMESKAKRVLDASFRVHTALGPGLLESAYSACLLQELRDDGLEVRVEVPVPVVYKGMKLADVGYRIDLLVEGEIVLEIKATEGISDLHLAQLLSYLKLSKRRLGFLLNFNVESFRNGIYRRVNRL